MTYHQTTLLTDDQLQDYTSRAEAQELRVLNYFRAYPWSEMTAEDFIEVMPRGTPITSIRRALTNLLNEGKIQKSGQKPGQYGRPITLFRIASYGL